MLAKAVRPPLKRQNKQTHRRRSLDLILIKSEYFERQLMFIGFTTSLLVTLLAILGLLSLLHHRHQELILLACLPLTPI